MLWVSAGVLVFGAVLDGLLVARASCALGESSSGVCALVAKVYPGYEAWIWEKQFEMLFNVFAATFSILVALTLRSSVARKETLWRRISSGVLPAELAAPAEIRAEA